MSKRYLFLYSGAIGEALLGIHIGRVLAANVPGASIRIVSPRPNAFVRELVADLPFAEYGELPKEKVRGWLGLLELIRHPYNSVLLKPVSVGLPLWWQIILWCARFQRGSVQVWYEMHGREYAAPLGVHKLPYVCQTESYFDTPPRVLELWGIPARELPPPFLPARTPVRKDPYILFHFFAGNYKRSIPIDHARLILSSARAEFPRHRFVMTCMDSEKERAERMCEGMTNIELQSGLAASSVLELLAGAELIVGTASGILLVAAHLSAPVIAMSCLSDPCWLPTFSPATTIIAAREECRCNGDKTGECAELTPEGDVYRCLFYIKTEEVIAAMSDRLRV